PEERGRGRIRIRPDSHAWQRLFQAGSARIVDFPLPGGERAELEVASYDVLAPGARFFVGGPGGLTETPGPRMRFFRGQVAGERDSIVSLNLFDGRMAGFVRRGGREYTFGPRVFAREREGADEIEVGDDAIADAGAIRCDGEQT